MLNAQEKREKSDNLYMLNAQEKREKSDNLYIPAGYLLSLLTALNMPEPEKSSCRTF